MMRDEPADEHSLRDAGDHEISAAAAPPLS